MSSGFLHGRRGRVALFRVGLLEITIGASGLPLGGFLRKARRGLGSGHVVKGRLHYHDIPISSSFDLPIVMRHGPVVFLWNNLRLGGFSVVGSRRRVIGHGGWQHVVGGQERAVQPIRIVRCVCVEIVTIPEMIHEGPRSEEEENEEES